MKFIVFRGSELQRAAEQAANLDPVNPFVTPEYVAARQQLGEQALVFGLESDGSLIAACPGFLKSGRLSSEVEIPSIASLPQDSPFWEGLRGWCRSQHVWDLHVNSFGSRTGQIPAIAVEASREDRTEYVLDLTPDEPLAGMNTNNKRNVSRGKKSGLLLDRTREASACDIHGEMVNASLVRREQRGEEAEYSSVAGFRALLGSGAGELFQVRLEGEVVSSLLLLHGPKGSYYCSAGTSPEGMKSGASAFLIAETALTLKQEGRTQFNLGGAGADNPGLQRYKSSFGCAEVSLERASFSLVPALIQHVRKAASQIMARLS